MYFSAQSNLSYCIKKILRKNIPSPHACSFVHGEVTVQSMDQSMVTANGNCLVYLGIEDKWCTILR